MLVESIAVVVVFIIGCGKCTVVTPNIFSTSINPADGYFPNLGNGNIAFDVGCPTSDGSSSAGYIFAAGTYSGTGSTSPSKRARIPQIETIFAGDAYLGTTICDHSWVAELDIEKAVFSNVSTYTCDLNVKCEVRITSLVHAVEAGLIVHHISTTPHCTYTMNRCPPTSSSEVEMVEITEKPNSTIILYRTTEPELPGGDIATIAIASELAPMTIYSTNEYVLRTVVHSSVWSTKSFDVTSPFSHLAQWSDLLHTHIAAWKIRWASGIEIHGNDTIAAAVNASFYYILSSVSATEAWSVSPGGLAKNSYNGHIFWDCETWMLPALAPFYPDITSSFAEYRLKRLDAAVGRAKERGYAGAMMPWESAYSGIDVTPTGNIEGDYEIHVTADIPLAMKSLYEWSGDEKWLMDYWDMIQACCDYVSDRVSCENNSCTYLDVQPPDEQAGIVNSSVYTNAAAKVLLSWAAAKGKELHMIPRETSLHWRNIADSMIILLDTSLSGTLLHPEYDGYAGEYINQADTVLLQFPLQLTMPNSIKYNDLIYYEARTSVPGETRGFYTGDSSYSIGYLNLLRQKYIPVDGADLLSLAANQFEAAFKHIDFSGYLIWRETLDGGHYNFITGAGGFLQNVIYGYAGVVVSEDALIIEPLLPPGNVTAVTLRRLHYQQSIFSVMYDVTTITIHVDYGSISISTGSGNDDRLSTGDTICFASPSKLVMVAL